MSARPWRVQICDFGDRGPWQETIFDTHESSDAAIAELNEHLSKGVGCTSWRFRVINDDTGEVIHV